MQEVDNCLGGSRPSVQETALAHWWDFLLRAFYSCSRRLPSEVFVRTNQIVIDAIISSVSIYLAYQIRFDGAVPPQHAEIMWGWVMALPVLRVAVMVARKTYNV